MVVKLRRVKYEVGMLSVLREVLQALYIAVKGNSHCVP